METAGAVEGDKEFDLFGNWGIELSEASPSGTSWAWAARGLIYQQETTSKKMFEYVYSSRSKGPFVERLVIWPRQMLGISRLSKFISNRKLSLTSFIRSISTMPFGR